ncbi:MAG: 4Fe-4S binding protein, partial [Gammaproteobacteria bacterium]
KVVGVEMVHMKKLPDEQGRLHRIAFEGTETVLHVDMVIPAIGQVVDPAGLEAILNGAPHLHADGWGETGHAGVFAGGDATGQGGTVTEAVGAGRRAAQAIDNFIKQVGPPKDFEPQVVGLEGINLAYYEPAHRSRETILPVAERTSCDEIDQGLSGGQVQNEARRCFSCGNCLACDNCFTLCPDSAVLKTREFAADGSHYVFDYDYCKGCGLCANECPCGYIRMVPEP